MGKSHVKVYVRTRPTARDADNFRMLQDTNTVAVTLDKVEGAGPTRGEPENLTFKFDGVLNNVSQEAMFNTTAAEVVDTLMAGYNCTIFSYGQTGAGKTFTMAGDLRNYHHRGIIPRAIHQVFREADMRVDRLYKVHVSYLEIYNENMYDLLSSQPGSSDSLAILDDGHTTYVRGLTKVAVHSEEEALGQFFVGDQGRSTAFHVLNTNSSRSHCVFTIHIEMRTSAEANEKAVLAKLHLVDLAGSERTKKTNATGQTLKEANFINKSLTFLEQTVNALSRRDTHVPFRQSKLTSVLRDALGGNCKTVMVANVWPEPGHMEETVSTLRFAARVKTLVTDVYITESSDPNLLVKRYERQIKELKQELAMRDALGGRGRINYEDLKDSEQRAMNALAKQFLAGQVEVDELPQDSLKNIREMYKQLRAVHQAVASQLEQDRASSLAAQQSAIKKLQSFRQGEAEAGAGVGEVDRGVVGMPIGTAPTHAKPKGDTYYMPGSPDARSPGRSPSPGASGRASPSPGGGGAEGGAGDLNDTMSLGLNNAAFQRFKHDVGEGQELYAVVKQRAGQLREMTAAIRDAGASANDAKQRIDELNAALAVKAVDITARSTAAAGGEQATDAEHYNLLQELKLAKKAYREAFDRLKEMKQQREPVVELLADARQQLVQAFQAWNASSGLSTTTPMTRGSEQLDAGEAFERMQMDQITAIDPDMTAYASAKKRTTGLAGSTVRGPAVFGGDKAKAVQARKREQRA